MSAAIDALRETPFFGSDANPVLPVPVQSLQKPVRQAGPPATRRLTVDIPADLHMRMRLETVKQGTTLNDIIRGLLLARFPA